MQVTVKEGRILMGRLPKGADLLDSLTDICTRQDIKLGEVRVIGAVSQARVGYYDQDELVYGFIDFNEHLEIASLVGNVSLKDGKPFVHAHVTFADEKGSALGGHLAEGTLVFAAEYVIREFISTEIPERKLDGETGLYLWDSSGY